MGSRSWENWWRFRTHSNWSVDYHQDLCFVKDGANEAGIWWFFRGFHAGTTIAGVRELENRGFRAALMNAVIAGAERAKELSKWFYSSRVFILGWQWQCNLQFQSKQVRDCLGSSIACSKSMNYLFPNTLAIAPAGFLSEVRYVWIQPQGFDSKWWCILSKLISWDPSTFRTN